MRHESVEAFDRIDEADLAAIWPKVGDFAPPAISELQGRPTPAAPDLPAALGKMLVAAYAAPILIFLLTLAGSREALFMIVISGLYIAIYLAVPWLMFRIEDDHNRRPTLRRFMADGIETSTGHLGGKAALAQMLLVPLMLSLCILWMGTMALIFI